MRILLLSQSYPPVLGGLQTAVHHLSSGLSRQGHAVQVVTNRYPRNLPSVEVRDNVSIQRWQFLLPDLKYIQHNRMDLFLAGIVYGPMVLGKLNGLVRDFRPEVVNLHFPDIMIPFVLDICNQFDSRLVVSLHGNDVERWFENDHLREIEPYEYKYLNKFKKILCEADWVTACSTYLLSQAQQVEPSLLGKSSVIYNGVDSQRLQNAASYACGSPYIFACGRLTRVKGFDLLIDAFSRFAINFPLVNLILAGAGEEKETLEIQVQKTGLENRIHFWGQATPEEVAYLLAGASFVVIPSRQESFGMFAIEALASGKPVIASRVGGLIEILDKTQAMLVDPSIDSLAQALSHWLSTPPDWNSCEAKARANQFSWQKTIDEYEAVLLGEK